MQGHSIAWHSQDQESGPADEVLYTASFLPCFSIELREFWRRVRRTEITMSTILLVLVF